MTSPQPLAADVPVVQSGGGIAITAQLERVLIGGDLSQLKPEERVMYYKAVCESVGLNPLTKPFEYITLNGKLTLYARRDATDQLRNINCVSIEIKSREVVEDCYIVTAAAITPTRSDESIGAVSIAGLKGEARANAMMKAETKAKRRVTLSVCGLGMLDETEVETIPSAKHAATITPTTGAADRVNDERRAELDAIAGNVTNWMAEGSLTDAFLEIDNANLDADEKVYLWTKFDSGLRRQLKEEAERVRTRNANKTAATPVAAATTSVISDAQRKRLEARISELKLDREEIKAICSGRFNKHHFADLTPSEYQQLDEEIDAIYATAPAPLPPPTSAPVDEEGGAGQPLLMSFEQGMSLQELLEEKLIPTAKLLAAAESVTGDVYMSISQIPADFYERATNWIAKQKSNRPNQQSNAPDGA